MIGDRFSVAGPVRRRSPVPNTSRSLSGPERMVTGLFAPGASFGANMLKKAMATPDLDGVTDERHPDARPCWPKSTTWWPKSATRFWAANRFRRLSARKLRQQFAQSAQGSDPGLPRREEAGSAFLARSRRTEQLTRPGIRRSRPTSSLARGRQHPGPEAKPAVSRASRSRNMWRGHDRSFIRPPTDIQAAERSPFLWHSTCPDLRPRS